MAEIEKILWNGEPLRAVIKFDTNLIYTVYTYVDEQVNGNFIKQINFSLREGNSSVNPLGIATSNNISLQIYDANDYLSPLNTESPYYSKLVNGVEIDLYISYDGENYEPYGIYYTTNWDGEFSEGWHGLVNISAEDKLNTIGNYKLPEVPAYENIQASDLIGLVLQGVGMTTAEYSVDPSIDKVLNYGIASGDKVRDFMNNISQLLFARVIIDRMGVLRFVPALGFYATSNDIIIYPQYTGSFVNKNTTNINYNKITVKYLELGETTREELFNDNSHVLEDGENIISDINFSNRALNIEQVKVLYEPTENGASIASMSYQGYQNGIQLSINVVNGPINKVRLIGEGLAASTVERTVSMDVDNSSVIGGTTFEFDTKQMMNQESASFLANDLRVYLIKISKNVVMKDTVLTPKLYIGDRVRIDGSGTLFYGGAYKVIGIELSMGEDYNMTVTMIRA